MKKGEPSACARWKQPTTDFPRRISAEGPLASLGVTKGGVGGDRKRGSGRHPYPVLPRGSEASLASLGTASFLPSFVTASTHHPVFSSVARNLPGLGKD
jgi:hypothetical protein